MKHLKAIPNNITMPFIPLNICSNQIFIVCAQPKVGRTLYSSHLIQDNSLKTNHSKCLAYFAICNREILKQSGFGIMMTNSDNVRHEWIRGEGSAQLIRNIKRDVKDFKPDYILIDGFEKCFAKNVLEGQLLNEVDKMLYDLRSLSSNENIPIVLTTKILLEGTSKIRGSRPLLCDFDGGVLEIINVDYTCGLHSPFYNGDTEDVEGENPWGILHVYQLQPYSMIKKPTDYDIDQEAGRFHPRKA